MKLGLGFKSLDSKKDLGLGVEGRSNGDLLSSPSLGEKGGFGPKIKWSKISTKSTVEENPGSDPNRAGSVSGHGVFVSIAHVTG